MKEKALNRAKLARLEAAFNAIDNPIFSTSGFTLSKAFFISFNLPKFIFFYGNLIARLDVIK